MSYILDALRKSERDRRAGSVPSLDDLSLDSPDQPQNKPWVAILIGLMIFINLVTLIVVFMYDRAPSTTQIRATDQTNPTIDSSLEQNEIAQEEITTRQVVSDKIVPHLNTRPLTDPIGKQESAKQQVGLIPPIDRSTTPNNLSTEPVKTESKIEHHTHSKPLKKPAKQTLSNPETTRPTTVASKPTAQKNPKSSPQQSVIVSSVTPKNQTQTKLLPPKTTVEPPHGRPSKPELNNPTKVSPSLAKTNEASKLSPHPSKLPTAKPDKIKPQPSVPLLREMSRDFQRQVPSLNINVFVYSDIEDERFVIINMVKYTNGQKVREGPIVGEIRPDSVILNYQGRDFRLKRP